MKDSSDQSGDINLPNQSGTSDIYKDVNTHVPSGEADRVTYYRGKTRVEPKAGETKAAFDKRYADQTKVALKGEMPDGAMHPRNPHVNK